MTSTTLSKPRAAGVAIHQTIAGRTKRVYDRLAFVYPLSTFFFHSKAHKVAIQRAAIQDGSRVLEVACGSGEMFARIIRANPGGVNCGVDLSPKMAEFTQRKALVEAPRTASFCQASDVRQLPFREASFETVVCCYLFELLGCTDLEAALIEVRRVLKAWRTAGGGADRAERAVVQSRLPVGGQPGACVLGTAGGAATGADAGGDRIRNRIRRAFAAGILSIACHDAAIRRVIS